MSCYTEISSKVVDYTKQVATCKQREAVVIVLLQVVFRTRQLDRQSAGAQATQALQNVFEIVLRLAFKKCQQIIKQEKHTFD